MIALLVLVCIVAVAGGCTRSAERIESAELLIEAMRDRYDGKWYETLTFTQETIRYMGEQPDTSTWYEALSIPGKLRIDIAPVDSGNGLLFANNHRYVFQHGRLVFDRAEIHPLLLLGFDVYASPAERTLAGLDSVGIDLKLMHQSSLNGQPVYVVGATEGDLERPQFWVDQENLLFVRLLQHPGGGLDGMLDIRFEDYEPVGEAWIAPRVDFFHNDSLVLRETYYDIRVDGELNDSLFNPVTWVAHNRWMTEG